MKGHYKPLDNVIKGVTASTIKTIVTIQKNTRLLIDRFLKEQKLQMYRMNKQSKTL